MTLLDFARRLQRAASRASLAFVIVIALAVIAGGLFWWWKSSHAIVLADRLKSEFKGLQTTSLLLSNGPVPSRWDFGAFISPGAFEQALNQLSDVKITPRQPPSSLPDLTFAIGRARLIPRDGLFDTAIRLEATSQKQSLHLDLEAKAILAFENVTLIGSPPSPVAAFRISFVEIAPALDWHSLRVSTLRFLSDVLTVELMRRLDNVLKVYVPVKQNITADLSLNELFDVPIEQTGGSISFHAGLKESQVTVPITFEVPLVVQEGVWLLGNEGTLPQALPDSRAVDTLSEEQLKEQIANLQKEIRSKRESILVPTGNVAAFINGKALVSLISKVNSLPEDNRSVNVRSVRRAGRVYEDKWSDNVLGNGGVYAELPDNESAVGVLKITSISPQWEANRGLSVTVRTAIDAQASLHVHIDPLFWGGVGTTVGLKGTAAPTLTGFASVDIETLENVSAVILKPNLMCQLVQLGIDTTGSGPQVSVKTFELIGQRPLLPTVLLDSVPSQLRIQDLSNDAVKVDLPFKAIDVTTKPTAGEATKDGLLLAASLSVERSKSLEPPTSAETSRAAFLKALKAKWESQAPNTCPAKPRTEISVAGVNITESISQVQDRVQAVKNELQKIVTRPGDALRDAPGNFVREGGNLVRQVGDFFKKIF
jgi:hypothetical protein